MRVRAVTCHLYFWSFAVNAKVTFCVVVNAHSGSEELSRCKLVFTRETCRTISEVNEVRLFTTSSSGLNQLRDSPHPTFCTNHSQQPKCPPTHFRPPPSTIKSPARWTTHPLVDSLQRSATASTSLSSTKGPSPVQTSHLSGSTRSKQQLRSLKPAAPYAKKAEQCSTLAKQSPS